MIPSEKKVVDKALIRKDYLEWCGTHFEAITMADGNVVRGLAVESNGSRVIVNKTFFNETFAKNHRSKKLAETMELCCQELVNS